MSLLQEALQMTGKDVHYILSELKNGIYSIISFLYKKWIYPMHRKILEANMPVAIVNGRLLRIFKIFLFVNLTINPLYTWKPIKSYLRGRRCRAEGPAGWGLQQTAGRMMEGAPSPRGSQGPHIFASFLFSDYFPICLLPFPVASVYIFLC